ncbi:DUF2892 domain-containing protein [Pedobacter sp. HMF7647]|uniref:DUF2892 domain-containing protein n=1 Tax=Hufsiella arboris TaxID=2695275 RepID=A0A7K1YAC5_9SPHI|nr:DUF2892 domain-containing protein [Hufsiella arboris]MXV51321.1 DUF2892 domain-containing protein [Hufsiella arboris]
MITNEISRLAENIKDSWAHPNDNANIEQSERIVSVAAGAFIFIKGITNLFSHPILALGEVAVGGGLVYRGITGYCPVKDIQERNTFLNDPDSVTVTEHYIVEGV